MNLYQHQLYTIHLPQADIDAIYRRQQRLYWESDFIGRCIDRSHEKTGLCNIPLENAADNTALLDMAYKFYLQKEDCNTAYNDTLDAVIDEVEAQIRDHGLPGASQDRPRARVAIVIEDGITSMVRSTDPLIQIEITELDKDYANCELQDSTYARINGDAALQPCDYSLHVPGYE